MRSYTIKKIEHHVYEDLDELPADLVYLKDWRQAEIGDWVLADDACVIQVLRKNALTKPRGKVRVVHSLGTCTGTFKISDKMFLFPQGSKNFGILNPSFLNLEFSPAIVSIKFIFYYLMPFTFWKGCYIF